MMQSAACHSAQFLAGDPASPPKNGIPNLGWICSGLATGRYSIFFPKAESASPTARSAVWLCSSITGFTSTISKLVMWPWSEMISIGGSATSTWSITRVYFSVDTNQLGCATSHAF